MANTGLPTNPDGQSVTTVIAPVLSTSPHAAIKILYGSGVPATSVGADGDFYRNVDNDDLYGPKISGAWPDAFSIRGYKGDQGPPGPAGSLNTDDQDALDTAAAAAQASAQAAAASATAAATSAAAVAANKAAAAASAQAAANSETNSNTSKGAAAASATASAASATQAAASNTAAGTARDAASASATAANASKVAAGVSETNSAASATAANTSKLAAGVSEQNAANAATAAAGYRDQAQTAAQQALSGAAPNASPTFTGIPRAPTPAPGTNSTQLATTAFVVAAVAAGGGGGGAVSSVAGRTGAVVLTIADITGAAPLASPALTGTPTVPTAATATNTTQAASTAFVKAQGYATLASPAFTGTPTVPTATAGTNTAQAASTAFVMAAMAAGGGSGGSTDAGMRYVESFTAGGTDNTVQLQAAYAWLQAAPYRTLAFQHNKVYTVSAQCNLQAAHWFRIEGNGATIKGAAGMSTDYGWLLLNMTSCTDGLVVDLFLDGNRSARPVAVGKEEAHNVQVWTGNQRVTFVRVQSDNACCDGFYLGADDPTNSATFPTDIRFIDCQANNGFRNNMSLINTVRFRDYAGFYNGANGTDPQDGIDLEPNGTQADGNLGNINPEFHGTTTNNNNGLGIQIYLDSNTGAKFYDITAKNNPSGAFGCAGGDFEIRGFTVEDHYWDTDRGVIDIGPNTGNVLITNVVSKNNNTEDPTNKPLIYVDAAVTGLVAIDGVMHSDSDCPVLIAEAGVQLQNVESHNQSLGYIAELHAGTDLSLIKNVVGRNSLRGLYVNAPDVVVSNVRLTSPRDNAPLLLFDTGALRASLDGYDVYQDSAVPAGQIGARFINAPARVTNVIGRSGGTAWTAAQLLSYAGGTTGSLIANISPSSGGTGAVTSVAGRTGVVTLAVADVSGAAPLASPSFTGTPLVPTATAGTNNTQAASTAFVTAAIAAAGGGSGGGAVSSVAGRTGAVVLTIADITGAAPLASPAFTGTPTVPTAGVTTNTTQAASTAFVKAQGYATLASPAFTGTPTVPTATAGTNTTQAASTAFVTTAVAAVSGGGGAAATVKASAWNNFKKSNTQKLSAIIARGAAGRLRGRITIIGDSYSMGYGAGDGDNMNGGRAKNYSTQLAAMLTARGVAARADWTVGTGFTGSIAELNLYDPRVTFTGCSILTDYNAIGGNMIQLGSTTDKMTFTPGVTFNTIEILVACNNQAGVSGNFDVLLNGGTTVSSTQTSNDIMGVKKITLTVAAGTTSVSLRGKTNNTFIAGIGTRNSAAPGIEVICGASTGEKVNILAAAPTTSGDVNTWNNRASSTALLDTNALNVTIINGWYNDRAGLGRTTAQVQSDLATLIGFYKTYGDVIFLGYVPLITSDIPQVDFDTYQNAAFATCVAADIPYINPPAALGTNAVMLAQGFFGDNGLHCGSIGHAAVARLILGAIDSVI
jgi:hypothetical protein